MTTKTKKTTKKTSTKKNTKRAATKRTTTKSFDKAPTNMPNNTVNKNDLLTVWNVEAGVPVEFYVRIRANAAKQTARVDWGDGCVEEVEAEQTVSHVYKENRVYVIAIQNNISRFSVLGGKQMLVDIKQWGTAQWVDLGHAFNYCVNMTMSATDVPDFSRGVKLYHMFFECSKFNSPINHWDVKNVKDAGRMLAGAVSFRQNLSNWVEFSNRLTLLSPPDTGKNIARTPEYSVSGILNELIEDYVERYVRGDEQCIFSNEFYLERYYLRYPENRPLKNAA